MHDYMNDVINNLSTEDLQVLTALYDKDATTKFKGITHKKLVSLTNLTTTIYENTLNRLLGNCFIAKATEVKKHKVYITVYGIYALEHSLPL